MCLRSTFIAYTKTIHNYFPFLRIRQTRMFLFYNGCRRHFKSWHNWNPFAPNQDLLGLWRSIVLFDKSKIIFEQKLWTSHFKCWHNWNSFATPPRARPRSTWAVAINLKRTHLNKTHKKQTQKHI